MGKIQISKRLGPFICATFIEYVLCTRHNTRHQGYRIEISKIDSLGDSLVGETLLQINNTMNQVQSAVGAVKKELTVLIGGKLY